MEQSETAYQTLLLASRFAGLKSACSDAPEKRWISFIILILHVEIVFSMFDFLIASSGFANRENLVKFIVNMVVDSLLIISFSLFIEMWKVRHEFLEMTLRLRWLHQTEVTAIKGIFERNFHEGYEKCNFFINIPRVLAVACQLFFVVVGTALSYFILKEQYPLPTFYVISFYPPTGWISWTVNMIHQILLCSTAIRYFVFCTMYILYTSCLTIAHLSVIIDIVQELDTLQEELSFEEWVKVVADLTDKSKSIIMFTRNKFKIAFYEYEKSSYIALFGSWLIWQIDPVQIATSFAGSTIVIGLFAMVYLNEQFMDKFDDLVEALYDVPWYDFKNKERKALLLLIQSAQHPISLSSGGLKDLTFEFFGDLVNSGYSAGLVLQDLVTV